MLIKFLEVRDEATCIPVIAIRMASADYIGDRFLWRCGYPRDGSNIVMMRLDDQRASSDPHSWGDRTHQIAHNYIYDNFGNLQDGNVIDVRAILGETSEPVKSEIIR